MVDDDSRAITRQQAAQRLDRVADDRARTLRRIVSWIDLPGRWVGKLSAWLIVPMMGVLLIEVFSRYAMGSPTMWAYDLTYMFYGALFMLAAAYTLGRDAHVRADFLFNMLSPRAQGVIDATFHILLFFPALAIFTWGTWDYALISIERGERIPTSPWMPIIWPLKLVLPITGALLLIQGVSELAKSLFRVIYNRPFAVAEDQQ